MKKAIRSLPFTAGATILSAILYIYTVANKEGIVIRRHYSGWRSMTTIGTVSLIVTGIALVLNLAYIAYKSIKHRRSLLSQEKQAKQHEMEISEARKLRNPEDVRKFFIRICGERPHCQVARDIKKQLDEMKEYQQKFANLLEVNDISMSKNIEMLLQEIEDGICANCKIAINKYIVGDDIGFEEMAKRVYEKNKDTLEKVRSFLGSLTDFAGGNQTEKDDAIRNLAIYEEKIRESINEEVY